MVGYLSRAASKLSCVGNSDYSSYNICNGFNNIPIKEKRMNNQRLKQFQLVLIVILIEVYKYIILIELIGASSMNIDKYIDKWNKALIVGIFFIYMIALNNNYYSLPLSSNPMLSMLMLMWTTLIWTVFGNQVVWLLIIVIIIRASLKYRKP